MARTQLDERSIRDGSLTGASFRSELMFYDETHDYTSGDRVYWKDKWFEAQNSITGGVEGDLSSTPDLNTTDWKEVTNVMWSAYPSAAQTFNDTAVTLAFDTIRTSNASVSLSAGEVTFNSDGNFILHFSAK